MRDATADHPDDLRDGGHGTACCEWSAGAGPAAAIVAYGQKYRLDEHARPRRQFPIRLTAQVATIIILVTIKLNLNTKAALHFAYLVGIALKGLDGLLETAGGAVLLLISRPAIVHLTEFFVQGELSEDPRDFIAAHALHAAKNLSPGTQQFASAYLLVHGAIKVGLVAGLMRGWRRAYPVALVLLSAFIGYQCFRLVLYHSVLLAAFTAIDIAIVVLIWLEWRRHPAG